MSKPEWSAWRKANYAFFHEQLSPLPKKQKLVDLGAGPVQFADIFKQFEYVGVDFTDFPDVSVITDLTKKLPFADNSVDIITLSNTLEHLPYPIDVLRECHRMLRRGGLIIATTPFLLPVHQAPYDFNRYTHYQHQRLLTDAGFQEIAVHSLGGQIDAYNTIELKTFDELYKTQPSILLKMVRTWRRAEMRIMRFLWSSAPASNKVTEGYGFVAIK